MTSFAGRVFVQKRQIVAPSGLTCLEVEHVPDVAADVEAHARP